MENAVIIPENGNELQAALDFNGPYLMGKFLDWIDRSPATTKAYTVNLRQFLHWLQDHGINHPQRADILAYRDYLTASGFKASTVAAYLRNVKQLFLWASNEGIYPNVAQNIRCPKVGGADYKKAALDPSDVEAIEENIYNSYMQGIEKALHAKKDKQGKLDRSREQGLRLSAMYLLAVVCGLRTIELSRANVSDLEQKGERAYIYIWGKGRSEADQKKPLPAEIMGAIKQYLTTRGGYSANINAPLFTSTGNRGGGKRLPPTTISMLLKKAMRAAGYDSSRITAHSLRHTAGTAAQEVNGGDLLQTQEYMRHANPATTERYLHNKTEKQQAQLADKIYKYLHGEGSSSDATTARILELMENMGDGQLEQLADAAEAIARYGYIPKPARPEQTAPQ